MSLLEDEFKAQLDAAGFPPPRKGHYFALPEREWRCDWDWEQYKIMVELEGGVWVNGHHTQPAGYANDCAKGNLAILQGWRLFRFTDRHVHTGYAVNFMRRVFEKLAPDVYIRPETDEERAERAERAAGYAKREKDKGKKKAGTGVKWWES